MSSILHPEEFKNVEAWIQHVGKEIMRDDADLDGLTTLIMTHAFGRTPLPPEVAGVLAISHLLAKAKPEDRQGIRQLATAWFTDQPSNVTDPARWSVRSAARLPAAPSIPLSGHSSSVSDITAFTTRDGHQRLASAGFDGTIRVWDPFTARQVGDPLIGHGGKVIRLISMALDDAVLLVSAHQDGLVRFWDAEIQLLIGEPLAAHRDFTYALDTCVIDGCDLLTTGGSDGTLRIWDPVTRQQIGELFSGHEAGVTDITTFTTRDNQPRIASISTDGTAQIQNTIQIWDSLTGKQLNILSIPETEFITSITAWNDDDPLLAATGIHGTLHILDPISEHYIGTAIHGHSLLPARAVTPFTRNEKTLLASIGEDSMIQFWNPTTQESLSRPMFGNIHGGNGIVIFTGPENHHLLATANNDDTVRIWDPVFHLAQDKPHPLTEVPRNASFPCDETIEATESRQAYVSLSIHPDQIKETAAFTTHEGAARIAAVTDDHFLTIWDPATGERLHAADLYEYVTNPSEFTGFLSLDVLPTAGEQPRLVTGDNHNHLRIWDEQASQLQDLDLGSHVLSLWKAAALPDGTIGIEFEDGWAIIQLPDPQSVD